MFGFIVFIGVLLESGTAQHSLVMSAGILLHFIIALWASKGNTIIVTYTTYTLSKFRPVVDFAQTRVSLLW